MHNKKQQTEKKNNRRNSNVTLCTVPGSSDGVLIRRSLKNIYYPFPCSLTMNINVIIGNNFK